MRAYAEIDGDGGSRIVEQVRDKIGRLNRRMASVRRIIAVVSGKGGVGKSSVTANLAAALARNGNRVGVLDADINGSSIPHMFGIKESEPRRGESGFLPRLGAHGVKIMSMDFFAKAGAAPASWEGPAQTSSWIGAMEATATRELLADTEWEDLDYLLIDTPPVLSKLNDLKGLLPGLDGVIIVTIPSEVALRITLKTIHMVRTAGGFILGVVENMKGHICEHCGKPNGAFNEQNMERSIEFVAPYLGHIPFLPDWRGVIEYPRENAASSATARFFQEICGKMVKNMDKKGTERR